MQQVKLSWRNGEEDGTMNERFWGLCLEIDVFDEMGFDRDGWMKSSEKRQWMPTQHRLGRYTYY